MSTVLETGAVFKLIDEFSGPLSKLIGGIESAASMTKELQATLDRLGLNGFVNRAREDFAQFNKIAAASIGGLDEEMVKAVDASMGTLSRFTKEAGGEMDKIKVASAGAFTAFSDSAKVAADSAVASMARVSRSIEEAGIKSRAAAAGSILPGGGAMRPHGVGGSGGHGGVHMRSHGFSVPGGHVGFSGDGTAEAVGAFSIYELMKGAFENDMQMGTIASQYMQNGFTASQITAAKNAAWANTRNNPNASALEGFGDILELNKATGNLGESIETLPAMSRMDTLLRSVKGEHYNREGQILNYAKGLEELGVTQMGNNPEERRASIERYTKEFSRTMVSSRGLFDGNALFAMTNNSGGSSSGWDMRMATVVAPILGDIMKHGKLGNADYMALKSYAGGGITSKAVEALMKYGLTDSGDTWQDKKGEWHLNANSKFAEGITENVFDWSGRMRERLREHGFDPNSQKAMRAVTNEIGSNKSNTMLMRAILEPMTRGQIVKEMALRDAVPDDPTSIAQQNSPALKLDAFHKSWGNFETALGTGLTGPAMDTLNKLTAGLSGLGQFLEAHPSIAKVGADMTIVAGGIMGLSAAVKLLGINTSGARAAFAATGLGAGAGAGGSPLSIVAKSVTLFALADIAQQNHVLDDPKRDGWRGVVEGLDPGIADWWFGKVGQKKPEAGQPSNDGSDSLMHLNKFTGDQIGKLGDKTGALKIRFDGLDSGALLLNDNFKGLGGGAGSLGNDFKILELTALGAARALASVAMSGGIGGGGGGFTNASWGGGVFSGNGRIGGDGPGVGHFFSAAEREANIRATATSLGINPNVAMAVARSEGFGRFDGDHGTSFGDLQMHIGGGLGDLYRRATGKNPADPHNELELDRFALGVAKHEGWGAWHGAARIGVHGMQGIGSAPTVSAPPPRVAPGAPAAGQTSADRGGVTHVHVAFQVGKNVIQRETVKVLASASRFPHDMGGPDNHGSYLSPGTPVTDAA